MRAPSTLIHTSVALPFAPMTLTPPGVTPAMTRPFQFSSFEHFQAAATEAIDRVLKYEQLTQSTMLWMRSGYLSFHRYLIETRAADELLSGDFYRQEAVLVAWRGWLLERGTGRVTVRTYWGGMKALCSRLARSGGMASPFDWIPPPRVGRVLPKSLTRDAAKTVLNFVENFEWRLPFFTRRNSAMVGTMLLAGLRSGEVLRLLKDDVDCGEGTIRIQHGKGRDGGKDRTAYMTPQLRSLLSSYMETRARLRPAAPTFFVSLQGRELTQGAMKTLFATISDKTGIHVSPHRLRHTYATLLRQSGVPDRVSMDLLGHTQLAMLQRYSHVFEGEYRTEVQKLIV
jgi:integrase/recombinase XerD